MFKEEINIYQTRCEKFLSRIGSDRFSVEIPLEVEVGWSKTPVAFKDREKLSYRPIKEGEKWGEAWENAYFKLSGTVPDYWQMEECILNLNFSGEALVFTPEGVPFYSLTGGSVFDPWYYKSSFPLPAEWEEYLMIDLFGFQSPVRGIASPRWVSVLCCRPPGRTPSTL